MPIFIAALATLVCLIKICLFQIIVFSAYADQAKIASVQDTDYVSYSSESVLRDSGLDLSGISLDGHYYGLMVEGITDVEKIVFSCNINLAFPFAGISREPLQSQIFTRKWIGQYVEGDVFAFEDMERDENADHVYVFPRSGGRFHGEGCRYINSYAQKTVLSNNLRDKYEACPLCTEGNEQNGQSVYIFRYGNSYHRTGCNSVDKYVICMDRSDAKAKGYSACSVCGG
ncbi:MAG: hypothetical protein HFE90_01790 [Firmicutes bacterium]|nr:hypothetical protein [Bacillota bacterium]